MFFMLIEWVRGWIMPFPFWINDLGRQGEYLVRRSFHRKGYHCVAKNWRRGKGEIDIIMANHRILIFIEVKTRSKSTAPLPSQVLGYEQQQRLLKLAEVYLAQFSTEIPWRYYLAVVWFPRPFRSRIGLMDLD